MTLTFDWFLPTSGDGRTIVGRGHSLPLADASGASGEHGCPRVTVFAGRGRRPPARARG